MWPELLNDHYKPEYFENYGVCGAGNQFIAHQVAVANEKHKFTSDDLVVICWTHACRKDWFIPNGHNIDDNHEIPGPYSGWECGGNIWNADDKLNGYTPMGLKIPSDYLATSALCIYNTIRLLDALGVHSKHLQITPVFKTMGAGEAEPFLPEEYDNDQIRPLIDYCDQHLRISFFECISTARTWDMILPDHGWCDYHPLPLDSMKYIHQSLGIEFSEETVNKISKCESYVVEQFRSNPGSRSKDLFRDSTHAMYLQNFNEHRSFKFGDSTQGNYLISHMFEIENIKHKFKSTDVFSFTWNQPDMYDVFYDNNWHSSTDILPDIINITENNIWKDLSHIVSVIRTLEQLGCEQYHNYDIATAKDYMHGLLNPEQLTQIGPVLDYIEGYVEKSHEFFKE